MKNAVIALKENFDALPLGGSGVKYICFKSYECLVDHGDEFMSESTHECQFAGDYLILKLLGPRSGETCIAMQGRVKVPIGQLRSIDSRAEYETGGNETAHVVFSK